MFQMRLTGWTCARLGASVVLLVAGTSLVTRALTQYTVTRRIVSSCVVETRRFLETQGMLPSVEHSVDGISQATLNTSLELMSAVTRAGGDKFGWRICEAGIWQGVICVLCAVAVSVPRWEKLLSGRAATRAGEDDGRRGSG